MFKDLFSQHATAYSRYRPAYPPVLFEYLASICPEKNLAWDCATGNGQAATELAGCFNNVIATDPSAKQIAEAPRVANIEYRIEPAEFPSLVSGSADLVTIAQAIHWFDRKTFYAEAGRILKPRGIIAVIGYELPHIHPAIDKVIAHFHNKTIFNYWQPEHHHLMNRYSEIEFPFVRIDTPEFQMKKMWTTENLIGMISTWSAVQHFIKTTGKDPIQQLQLEIEKVWPAENERLEVIWNLILIAGRNSVSG